MSEQKIEYLYSENKWRGLEKCKIVRETKAYYFTENQKILKKRMYIGDVYSRTNYYIPTAALDEKFRRQKCAQMGIKMLDTLQSKATQKWLMDHYEEIKKLYDSLNRERGE